MKKNKKKYTNKFKEKIVEHRKDLPKYFENKNIKINTDSWFSITKRNTCMNNNLLQQKTKIKIREKTNTTRTIKIKMILNNTQKKIINTWFDAHTKMYNEGITYLRKNHSFTKSIIAKHNMENHLNNTSLNNEIYNFITLRSNLMQEKHKIINNTQLNDINKNTKIQTHTLDYALRQLCSNIKSAKTNLMKNNIKRFRIKYWRNNRCSKTLEIEKQYIKKNNICPNILGNIKYEFNKKIINLPLITSNVKINYNKILDEYSLFIPIKEINKNLIKPQKIISLDPGLRTYMTGVTENSGLKIGKNVNFTISKSLKRFNRIKNNKKIAKKIIKRSEFLINRKISNKIDDLHWKTIKYLTSNYNTILLGDMSAKSIVNKKNSVLSRIQKVACLRSKYYVFQQRLAYKSEKNGNNFYLINENHTSKTCSDCGSYNNTLGCLDTFLCKKCNLIIDRDYNGARNIYVKQFL
jgi:IS605 OrfB family transposase